jgi:very-short-patch-repair endonuclease
VSRLEDDLAFQIRAVGLPEPVREFRFAPPRRWRADFAFLEQKILIEVEGAIWTGGRHTRGRGFEADCAKYNEAVALGWRVIRVTGRHIKSGVAIAMIEKVFGKAA